jgi:monooxygenase
VIVTPRRPAGPMVTAPLIEMTSGYFQRSRGEMPLQGDRAPWRLRQHYRKDSPLFVGPITDEDLEFRPARGLPEL